MLSHFPIQHSRGVVSGCFPGALQLADRYSQSEDSVSRMCFPERDDISMTPVFSPDM
jgi:hypothetical protein